MRPPGPPARRARPGERPLKGRANSALRRRACHRGDCSDGGGCLGRHAGRGGLYALLSAVRSEAGWAIGTTATLEVLFGLPGVSQFLVLSIGARDYFVLLAYVMVVALWMEAGISGDTAQVSEALGEHAITYDKLRFVTYTFIAALLALALVNAVLVAWTTALDNARASSLFRALGATPRQVASGLTLASVLPALVAVVIGIPVGFAVFTAAAAAAGDGQTSPTPTAEGLVLFLPATLLLVAVLTAIPSPAAARKFTTRLFEVRPESSRGSFLEAPSTSTRCVEPTIARLIAAACASIAACNFCSRASFTSAGVSSDSSAAGVPGRAL